MEYFEMGSMDAVTQINKLKKVSTFKEKVRLVAISNASATVVLENNTIWYKGSSSGYHFPNDQSKSSFTQLKIW